jgi:hypothetical protein
LVNKDTKLLVGTLMKHPTILDLKKHGCDKFSPKEKSFEFPNKQKNIQVYIFTEKKKFGLEMEALLCVLRDDHATVADQKAACQRWFLNISTNPWNMHNESGEFEFESNRYYLTSDHFGHIYGSTDLFVVHSNKLRIGVVSLSRGTYTECAWVETPKAEFSYWLQYCPRRVCDLKTNNGVCNKAKLVPITLGQVLPFENVDVKIVQVSSSEVKVAMMYRSSTKVARAKMMVALDLQDSVCINDVQQALQKIQLERLLDTEQTLKANFQSDNSCSLFIAVPNA